MIFFRNLNNWCQYADIKGKLYQGMGKGVTVTLNKPSDEKIKF
jgi:hypothetical protein